MDSTCENSREGGEIRDLVIHGIKVSKTWQLVGIDLLGPLNSTAEGYTYVLSATDYFSKWVYAYPLKTKSSAEVASNLASMIYEQGCPQTMLSDQGSEFINKLNMDLCKSLEIDCGKELVHPAKRMNWMKKTNDNIKRSLSKVVNEKQDDWICYLQPTVFSLRSHMQCTTKYSPFQLMYGRETFFQIELSKTYPLDQIGMAKETDYEKHVEENDLKRKKIGERVVENIAVAQSKARNYSERRSMKRKSFAKADNELFQIKKKGRKSGPLGPWVIGVFGGKGVPKNIGRTTSQNS